MIGSFQLDRHWEKVMSRARDECRMMPKDSRYARARNTESECKVGNEQHHGELNSTFLCKNEVPVQITRPLLYGWEFRVKFFEISFFAN